MLVQINEMCFVVYVFIHVPCKTLQDLTSNGFIADSPLYFATRIYNFGFSLVSNS